MNREDLELYVMGLYEGDAAALERELADDPAARAIVADEARLDLLLRDAGAAAMFCPACDDLVRGTRCDACGAAVRPGGYAIERVLVSNAHGRMYAARDVDGKQVALKELAFIQSPAPDALAAFEREAKFLRALEHPAIPRFCASFQEGDGVHARYYLAQELVAGEALDDRLEAHWFTEAEILGIARQVIDVLVYLQGLSPMVIHRDIKPANLLARPDGTIAVVDFGAAHVHGATAAATAIGTFGYMPIEQLAGLVDATTDLYALGASLIHLLTRREPWQVLQDGLLADAALNVSRPVRAFIARLVAANPRDRFRSAADARAALDRLGGGRRGLRAVRWRPSYRTVLELAATVVVLSTVGGLAMHKVRSRGDSARDEDRPRRSTERARNAAARTALAELAEDMCHCTDRRCTTRVFVRLTADGWDTSDPELWTQPEIRRLNGCLSQIMAQELLQHPGSGEDGLASTASSTSTSTSTVTPTAWGEPPPERIVRISPPGGPTMALPDAVQAIGRSCELDVILPGDVRGELPGDVPPMRCDRILDFVTRSTGLTYGISEAGIRQVARTTDLVAEHRVRADRARHGIVDDPLPPGDVDLDVRAAPIRDVIQLLAGAGGVNPELPHTLDGSVTIHLAHVAWDRALVAVLGTAGLGYRYQAAGKRLRIAPISELDAERERSPHGFVELSCRPDTRVAIDGVDIATAAGAALQLAPGEHRITLTRRDRSVKVSLVEIAAGRTVQLHD